MSYAATESKKGPVECGVPQGSVLGPLFFLLYVNDMVKACGDLELILFADDTNVFAEDRNPRDLFKRVNKGLEELSIWFRCNKLTLNLKKTEFIYFGGPGQAAMPQEDVRIGSELIRQVQGVKFLGVWIDEGLRWTAYIEKVKCKVSQLLGVIGRVRTSLGGRAILSLYNGLVLPHLQYCLIVWGDFQGDRNKTIGGNLLKLQKRFAGMVAGATSRFHADPLFAKYGMLKLEDLYRQQLRIHGWQFWNGELPTGQAAMLQRVKDTHGYSTRSAGSKIAVSARDQGSISYRLPKEWDTLTEEGKQVKSLTAFKRNSKNSFIGKYKGFRCDITVCRVCQQALRGHETS